MIKSNRPPQSIRFITSKNLTPNTIKDYISDYPHLTFSCSERVPQEWNESVLVLPAPLFLELSQETLPHPDRCLPYGDNKLLGMCFIKGCYDYLKTPFLLDELFFRIHRMPSPGIQLLRDYSLHHTHQGFSINQKPLSLNQYENKILSLLYNNAGQVVSREIINQIVWGFSNPKSRRLDMHLSRLRKKIHSVIPHHSPHGIIVTQKNKGFLLKGYK